MEQQIIEKAAKNPLCAGRNPSKLEEFFPQRVFVLMLGVDDLVARIVFLEMRVFPGVQSFDRLRRG